MKNYIKKILVFCIVVMCIFVFLDCVTYKLVGGARWSSGLHLGGVDNWLYENGSMYTLREDGFTPGSSYFPGVVLLALLFRMIFGYGAETAIIISGGIVAVLSFLGFSVIATDNKWSRFWLTILAATIFVVEFPAAQSYLLELHPDVPALTCFLWGCICIDKFLKKDSKSWLLISILLMFASGLFKQNALFLYIGAGIYVLVSKTITLKNKLFVLGAEALAGLAVLFVVFIIDGCWYNCVTVNAAHSLLSFKGYILYGFGTCRNNIVYIVMIGAFFLLFITRNIQLERQIERLWMSAAVGWTFFCMYGAAKEGANTGNMEAAIISFMPFALIMAEKSYYYFLNVVDTAKINFDIKEMKSFKVVKSTLIILCIVGAFGGYALLCRSIKKQYISYNKRIESQNNFSCWLNEKYAGRNVAYNTISYELLNKANINKKSDLYTAAVWEMGDLLSDEELRNISIEENWDIVITYPGLDEKKFPLTFDRFYKLQQKKYPDLSEFYGSPIEVFIKK